MSNVQFQDTNLTNVDFNASKLDLTNLDRANVTNAVFADINSDNVNANNRWRGRSLIGTPASMPATLLAVSTNNNKYNHAIVGGHIVSTKIVVA